MDFSSVDNIRLRELHLTTTGLTVFGQLYNKHLFIENQSPLDTVDFYIGRMKYLTLRPNEYFDLKDINPKLTLINFSIIPETVAGAINVHIIDYGG